MWSTPEKLKEKKTGWLPDLTALQEWSQHWVQTTVTECIEPKGVVSPGSGMGHA